MTSKESQLSIEKKYKHLTDHEHILKRSDMYVGTVDTNTVNMWIYDKNSLSLQKNLKTLFITKMELDESYEEI
jgi:DNA gyrase/topoisomerase IV subunit B